MTNENNESLRDRELVNASGVYPTKAVAIVRAKGAHLWDAAGKQYIDCSSGHGVACLGHAHPRWVQAVSTQAGTLTTLASSFPNDQRAEFQERLIDFLPAGFDRLFFCNSGTEAVEGALKFARRSTGRSGIVAAQRGFHGRTMGALSCTWEKKYREPFLPLLDGVQHAPYGNLEKFAELINEQTACVIVEVVQGEGGVRPAQAEFLVGLRALCDQFGALLVFDEVQTGFGRTGQRFAFQHFDVTPDLLALGKAIAGGIPMGAVAMGTAVKQMSMGDHGSTFGGNPLACAAGNATLKALVEEKLVERSAELGEWFRSELQGIEAAEVREVRGMGLMVAVDFRCRVAPILEALQDAGVVALPAGPTVLRFLPPFVIEKEDLARVVAALREVLESLSVEGAAS